MLRSQRMTWFSIALAVVVSGLLSGCSKKSNENEKPPASVESPTPKSDNARPEQKNQISIPTVDPSSDPSGYVTRGGAFSELPASPTQQNLQPEVLIKTSQGNIRIRLDAENAPLTVDNFLKNYVDRGFYSQTVFHYVEKGSFIFGGGYTSDLKAKPTADKIHNEAHNGKKNVRGTIAMARNAESAKSATSQFYINLNDNPQLDHQAEKLADDYDKFYGYCVFGEVIEGMEVADRIGASQVASQGEFGKVPSPAVVIESIERVK